MFNDHDVDGVYSPDDTGIAGVSIVLSDDTLGTCISTQTNGEGLYNFSLVLDGNYTLYESNNAGVPVPNTCPPSGVDPTDHLSVTANSIPVVVAGADIVGLDFADVRAPSLLEQHVSSVAPGASTVYSHRFVTHTDGEVLFGITESSAPQNSGWSSALFLDQSCDAQLSGDDTPIVGSLAVAANDTVCVLTKVNAATAIASGSSHQATLSASFEYADPSAIGHGLQSQQQRTDVTTIIAVAAGRLELFKYCLLYTSPSPRDRTRSRMPSSA